MRFLFCTAFSALQFLLAPQFSIAQSSQSQPCGNYMSFINNQNCDYLRYEQPRSERRIVKIIEDAYAVGDRIQTIGAGHSWSGIASPDGAIIMNLDLYTDTLSVSDDKKYVSFQAGIKLEEMCNRLDEMGRTLKNVPLILAGSLGGTIATGSGGTGPFGSISTYVQSLRLVLANGTILTVSRDDELYSSVGVSLGVLGVVSTVTLETVPAFNLKKTLSSVPWSQLPHVLNNTEMATDSFFSLSLWDDYSVRQNNFDDIEWQMETFTVTNEPVTEGGGCWVHFLGDCVDKNYLAVSRDASELILFENNGFKMTAEAHLPMEYAADYYSDFGATLKRLHTQGYADNKQTIFLHMLRFVEADDFDMSTSYKRNSLRADLGILTPEAVTFTKYFDAHSEIANLYQSRWHWGKANGLSGSRIDLSFPNFQKFADIRRELDEGCMFMNYYTEAIFDAC